jgi:hypothetical protein
MMDFDKVEAFFRAHWPAGLIVSIIVAPAAWTIASTHYSERITALELRLSNLTKEVDTLQELEKRRKERFVADGIKISRRELSDIFTPSDDVKVSQK